MLYRSGSWTEQDNGTKPNWAIVNRDDEFINQPSVMRALINTIKLSLEQNLQQPVEKRIILEKLLIGAVIVMEPLLQ